MGYEQIFSNIKAYLGPTGNAKQLQIRFIYIFLAYMQYFKFNFSWLINTFIFGSMLSKFIYHKIISP